LRAIRLNPARARHLVLDQADQIVMAHPFSVPLGLAVMGRQISWRLTTISSLAAEPSCIIAS
jgi:hypothetical protein